MEQRRKRVVYRSRELVEGPASHFLLRSTCYRRLRPQKDRPLSSSETIKCLEADAMSSSLKQNQQQQREMTQGNRATGSAISVMTQKKDKGAGLLRRRRTKRRSLVATVEMLTAMVSKKRQKTKRLKKRLNKMKAEVEEMETQCARMLEQNKLAIEENVDIQISADDMLLAFLCGGNG